MSLYLSALHIMFAKKPNDNTTYKICGQLLKKVVVDMLTDNNFEVYRNPKICKNTQ